MKYLPKVLTCFSNNNNSNKNNNKELPFKFCERTDGYTTNTVPFINSTLGEEIKEIISEVKNIFGSDNLRTTIAADTQKITSTDRKIITQKLLSRPVQKEHI